MKREGGGGKTIDRRVLIYDSPPPLNISSLWWRIAERNRYVIISPSSVCCAASECICSFYPILYRNKGLNFFHAWSIVFREGLSFNSFFLSFSRFSAETTYLKITKNKNGPINFFRNTTPFKSSSIVKKENNYLRIFFRVLGEYAESGYLESRYAVTSKRILHYFS